MRLNSIWFMFVYCLGFGGVEDIRAMGVGHFAIGVSPFLRGNPLTSLSRVSGVFMTLERLRKPTVRWRLFLTFSLLLYLWFIFALIVFPSHIQAAIVNGFRRPNYSHLHIFFAENEYSYRSDNGF